MSIRLLLLPLILVSLFAAIWTGWLRIGWSLPLTESVSHHGALMTGGFLATLIFLERAAGFKNKWIMLLPLVNGSSTIFFFLNDPDTSYILLVGGSAGFVLLCVYFIIRFRDLYYYLFLTGAICLLSGNMQLFSTGVYANAVPGWMGFFLFTIVAERLELSRFLQLNNTHRALLLASLLLIIVSLFTPSKWFPDYLFAAGLLFCAAWLLRYDMARHSLKRPGQHRYSATLLIVGYCWLIVTAGFIATGGNTLFFYDASLHSFFIGFVFAMIFSHAPIILPAVTKLPVKLFRPILYYWFVVLQLSLIIRITGDLQEDVHLRRWGGLINGIAILGFFITVIIIVRIELRNQKLHSKVKTT